MGRVITILGMGMSALRKADKLDEEIAGAEVWGLNNGYLTFPDLYDSRRFDRYFELHSWDYLQTWSAGEINGAPIDHFKTLANLQCPVYITERLPLIQEQTEYPFATVFDAFGTDIEVKGSPSWMLALALAEHMNGNTIARINSYGIDTNDARHANQRPSWSQWVLRAEMMGIELGGTATEFRKEQDPDAGLTGLLEFKASEYNENRKEPAKCLAFKMTGSN